MTFSDTILDVALSITLLVLGVAVLLAAIRMVRGPSLPDRVIALDLIGTIAVGVISVHSMRTGQPVYLTVAIVLALVLFVSTVAFAYFMEKGASK